MSAQIKQYQKKYVKGSQPQPSITEFEKNKQSTLLVAQSPFNNTWIQALILFVFSVLLYINTIGFKYTLDDMLMITSNKFTKEGLSGIKDILYNDTFVGFFGENKNLLPGGRYRPLSQVFFAIEYHFFGLTPFIGHLNNILMYGLLNVFLFLTLSRLFKPDKKTVWYLSLPFLITSLFVAHPLHTEVVANIKGRDEIMSLMASLGALWFVLNYIERQKIIDLALASFIFLLALLSKENAVTFFAVIPLVIYFFYNPSKEKYIAPMLALTIGLVAYLVLFRYPALGFIISNGVVEKELLNNPFVQATSAEKFATIFYTWLIYLKLLIFPHPLTHDYYPKQIPIINFSDIRAIASIIVYTVLTWFAFKNISKRNLIAFAILFFGITFSIQSNLVFNIGAFMNERFMFISLLGFCIVVAWLLKSGLQSKIKDNTQYTSYATTIFAVILILYSLKTMTRNSVWEDDFTLFTSDVKISTNSAKVNVSAGGMLIEKAIKLKDTVARNMMIMQAIPYLEKGMEIHKGHVAGWILLGNAYMHLNNYPLSRYYYENCLKISNKHGDAITNLRALGQNCINKKEYKTGAETYQTLLRYVPGDIPATTLLADCFANTGRADSAVILLNGVLEKEPKNEQALNKLGQVFGQFKGNLDLALIYLEKAYAIKQNDPSILENLGVAYGIKGQFQKAIFFFEKAILIKKDNPQLHGNLANTYMQIGQKDRAAKHLQIMQDLKNKGK